MDGSKDLVHGPIMRRMLFFALPQAFASVLQQIYNTADVVVAGRLIGADAMAAIASNTAASTALATLGCVVGSRMIWIFTVFNEHPLYDVLLAIYPLSWSLTLPFIIVIYLKSPLARGLESKPRPEAGGSGESGAQETRA